MRGVLEVVCWAVCWAGMKDAMRDVIEVDCLVVSMVVAMVDERAYWWAMKEADVKGKMKEMNWVVPWDAGGRLSVGVMV